MATPTMARFTQAGGSLFDYLTHYGFCRASPHDTCGCLLSFYPKPEVRRAHNAARLKREAAAEADRILRANQRAALIRSRGSDQNGRLVK